MAEDGWKGERRQGSVDEGDLHLQKCLGMCSPSLCTAVAAGAENEYKGCCIFADQFLGGFYLTLLNC